MAYLRTTAEVGILALPAITELKRYCFAESLRCDIKKLGGFLIQTYTIEISGEKEKISTIIGWLKGLTK